MRKNLILCTDSYKYSHFKQYPKGTEGMMSYIEARSGERVVFFGLQIFIKDYLKTPITMEDIDEADMFTTAHGVPFNREGWEYVLETYNGFMPVTIKAVPEGTVVSNRNVLATIECTDPKCFWVASFLETALLRGIWYPTSVATYSYECKQEIKKWKEISGDPTNILFSLHDFGARGVSSSESAGIGGAAHLVNFMGSDTVEGILVANRYYGVNGGMAGFSIAASEHSTITSWGKENERAAYKNMIEQYGGPGKMFACVSDSYDIINACRLWGSLKEDLLTKGGTLVVRPDSGDPASTVCKVVETLMEEFGFTINDKGYKLLPDCVRVIQGDGINKGSINDILSLLKFKKISADNVAFGMGGQLLQIINRDTFAFAMKCCSLKVNGEWKDVFKEAPGKNSKRGRITLVQNEDKTFWTVRETETNGRKEILKTVFGLVKVPGAGFFPGICKTYTFDEVRENSNK